MEAWTITLNSFIISTRTIHQHINQSKLNYSKSQQLLLISMALKFLLSLPTNLGQSLISFSLVET